MRKSFMMILAVGFVLFLPMGLFAQSEWVLYDNFDSGYIDEALWNIDDSSAEIIIENGKAKFTHLPGYPGDSSWLYFTNPDRIAAVKATILVTSSDGDCKARIGGNTAKSSDGYVHWQTITVQSGYSRIYYWSGELDPENNWLEISQRLYAELLHPYSGDLLGKEYTLLMTMQPTRRLMTGGPEVGMATYMTRQLDLTKDNDAPFLGIGTRSEDGSSSIVYFDNVYVKYN
jgi:hypothetical protein